MDDVVAFELDMEIFKLVEFTRVTERYRRTVDQGAHREQGAVNEQSVPLGQIEICMRHTILER